MPCSVQKLWRCPGRPALARLPLVDSPHLRRAVLAPIAPQMLHLWAGTYIPPDENAELIEVRCSSALLCRHRCSATPPGGEERAPGCGRAELMPAPRRTLLLAAGPAATVPPPPRGNVSGYVQARGPSKQQVHPFKPHRCPPHPAPPCSAPGAGGGHQAVCEPPLREEGGESGGSRAPWQAGGPDMQWRARATGKDAGTMARSTQGGAPSSQRLLLVPAADGSQDCVQAARGGGPHRHGCVDGCSLMRRSTGPGKGAIAECKCKNAWLP